MPPKGDWEYFHGEDLALNKVSGIYYALKTFHGLPTLYKTTKKKEKRLAKKELPRLIKEHLEQYQDGKRPAGKSPTVAEVIEDVTKTGWTSSGKPLRSKTKSKRAFYFPRIRDEMQLGPLPVDKLTLSLWSARLDRVRAIPPPEKGAHRKTYGDYSKHANILLRYAYQQKYVSHLITFPNPDKGAKEGTVFTLEEIRQLWSVMNDETQDQFVLGYECCMRLREALRLSWDRVDLESGEIILRAEDVKTGSKTGKGRQFIMSPHALERLRARKARQAANHPSLWIFPSPTGKGPVEDNKTAWNLAKQAVLKINPRFQHWGTWHHLRHTAITRMLCEQKMNITLVSEYVGTAIDTLQRVYLHSRAEHTRGVTQNLRITDAK